MKITRVIMTHSSADGEFEGTLWAVHIGKRFFQIGLLKRIDPPSDPTKPHPNYPFTDRSRSYE